MNCCMRGTPPQGATRPRLYGSYKFLYRPREYAARNGCKRSHTDRAVAARPVGKSHHDHAAEGGAHAPQRHWSPSVTVRSGSHCPLHVWVVTYPHNQSQAPLRSNEACCTQLSSSPCMAPQPAHEHTPRMQPPCTMSHPADARQDSAGALSQRTKYHSKRIRHF
jgi:hypothetical protein